MIKTIFFLIILAPNISMAKQIVVKVNDSPPAYRIWDVVGRLPVNYVCDAPTDTAQLKLLLDAQAKTDSLTVVNDSTNPGGKRAVIDAAKQAARQAQIDAADLEHTRKVQVRANRRARMRTLGLKIKDGSITAGERQELLGLNTLEIIALHDDSLE